VTDRNTLRSQVYYSHLHTTEVRQYLVAVKRLASRPMLQQTADIGEAHLVSLSLRESILRCLLFTLLSLYLTWEISVYRAELQWKADTAFQLRSTHTRRQTTEK